MNYYGCFLHAFRHANTGHLKVKVTVYYSTIGDCTSAGTTSWWPYFNLVKKCNGWPPGPHTCTIMQYMTGSSQYLKKKKAKSTSKQ